MYYVMPSLSPEKQVAGNYILTTELPPTGGQAGPIFAVLLQAGKDLSLQARLSLLTGSLRGWFF